MSLETLTSALNQARAAYSGHFAGQPRYSRNPTLLVELLEKLQEISADASGLGADELQEATARQHEVWTKELGAIQEVQQSGPHAKSSASLSQWIRDNHERYRRNFAGQNRATRDIGLLDEIIADLERRFAELEVLLVVRPDDASLNTDRKNLSESLSRYSAERVAIRSAQRSGGNDERIRRLQQLADAQYARYQKLFAGQARISRRAAVLESIVRTLEGLRHEWLSGNVLPSLDQQGNIDVITSRISSYRTEIDQIRAAQRDTPREQRAGALAQAANDVFKNYREEFAGKRRDTREPARANDLWESLWPVALEMEDMARVDDSGSVGGNLQLVRDALRRYEREWGLIREARGL